MAAQGKIEDLKAIDKEVEIHVWGSAGKMEETLKDRGMKVRREGRVMRIGHTGEIPMVTFYRQQQTLELRSEECMTTKRLSKIYFW